MSNKSAGVIKELQKITSRGHNPRTVFDDWLSLMLYGLMRNDEEYLKIVGRYKNDRTQGEREIDHFKTAFHSLLKKSEETNEEILGELYMEWGVSNKYTGQYFTPWGIAMLMAQLTGSGGSTYDPTCGSGVMLVASAKQMTNEQLDQAFFVGQDLDFSCVMMTALNMTFFNLNGYVIWGNTLTLEYSRVFETKRSYLGGSVREMTSEEVETIRPKIEQAKEEAKITQQALF